MITGAKNKTDAGLKRQGQRFIVAACPMHRHQNTQGRLNPNYRDLALRADTSIRPFIWPTYNWDPEPYTTMKN